MVAELTSSEALGFGYCLVFVLPRTFVVGLTHLTVLVQRVPLAWYDILVHFTFVGLTKSR